MLRIVVVTVATKRIYATNTVNAVLCCPSHWLNHCRFISGILSLRCSGPSVDAPAYRGRIGQDSIEGRVIRVDNQSAPTEILRGQPKPQALAESRVRVPQNIRKFWPHGRFPRHGMCKIPATIKGL